MKSLVSVAARISQSISVFWEVDRIKEVGDCVLRVGSGFLVAGGSFHQSHQSHCNKLCKGCNQESLNGNLFFSVTLNYSAYCVAARKNSICSLWNSGLQNVPCVCFLPDQYNC